MRMAARQELLLLASVLVAEQAQFRLTAAEGTLRSLLETSAEMRRLWSADLGPIPPE
jgi:hypothetical protein